MDASISTVHVLDVSQHAPLQYINLYPNVTLVESVTTVPEGNCALWLVHVEPQLIPTGLLVTVPSLALPVLERDSVLSDPPEAVNWAVTDLDASIVTVHVPVPLQAPLQPVNVAPVEGIAIRVTFDPLAKLALQVDPQLIPTGALVTVPEPVPDLVTESDWVVLVAWVKVAVTDSAFFMVTMQVFLLPEHAPLQLENVDPPSAVAVRVTLEFLMKSWAQTLPQLMPAGTLVTVPLPIPALITLRLTPLKVPALVTVMDLVVVIGTLPLLIAVAVMPCGPIGALLVSHE